MQSIPELKYPSIYEEALEGFKKGSIEGAKIIGAAITISLIVTTTGFFFCENSSFSSSSDTLENRLKICADFIHEALVCPAIAGTIGGAISGAISGALKGTSLAKKALNITLKKAT